MSDLARIPLEGTLAVPSDPSFRIMFSIKWACLWSNRDGWGMDVIGVGGKFAKLPDVPFEFTSVGGETYRLRASRILMAHSATSSTACGISFDGIGELPVGLVEGLR